MKPIRVCHILSGDLWAGAEVMAFQLIRESARRGDIDLRVLLLNPGRLAQELKPEGVPVELIPECGVLFPSLVRRTRKVLCQWRPDIVHSHRYKENFLAYLAIPRKVTCRLVATQHGMPESHDGRSLRSRLIRFANFRLLRHRFQSTVAVSRDIKDRLTTDHGFPNGRVRVIHNGIALAEEFLDIGSDGTPTIGSCGRLFPVKDYLLMVEVAHLLAKECTPIRFVLPGDGPERPRILHSIHRYELDDVFELPGQLDEMTSFYNGLSVFLNTSVHEGIPMSILEAMNAGVPVVAPAVGGIPEVVRDGVDGFLVQDRNPEAFAVACLRLIRNPDLRQSMSLSARERIRDSFSTRRMAEAYGELYAST